MKPYKITLEGHIVPSKVPTQKQQDDFTSDSKTGRTFYKTEVNQVGNFLQVFIADIEEKIDKEEDVSATVAAYETLFKTRFAWYGASFMYRIIHSEHVDGGMGNPGGSKLLTEYYQIDGLPVTKEAWFNEFS